MANEKILITIPFTQEQRKRIADAGGKAPVEFVEAAQATDDQIREAEVIMGNLPVEKIRSAGNLKWLQLNSAGANQYCEPGILSEQAVLTNAKGAYDDSVSEHMLACTMAMIKKLYRYYDNQKKRVWQDEGAVLSPKGACVVVLGLGSIGLAYARKMKALGSYVIGIRRHAGAVPEGVDELHTMEELQECLGRADIVFSILPETPDTIRLIGRDQLAAMKNSAYFLNAGRGSAVDYEALTEALREGKLAGAALDVTDPEPLPADSELWNVPNLYLTPHVAGDFHIPVTLDLIADICADNLKNYLAGKELKNVVNRKSGY